MAEDLYWGLLKVGDWATWAGALGSAAAAVGAWYAARQAIRIAGIPIKEQERDRLTRCRSIAPAVGPEFRRAKEDAQELANKIAKAHATSNAKELYLWARRGFIVRTASLERFADRFDLFGTSDGASVGAAAAAVLGLKSVVLQWVKVGERFESLGLVGDDIKQLAKLEAEARMVATQVDSIGSILEKYGGGKTQWEV